MAGLNVFTSNRMEILADQLAYVLAKPLVQTLASEIILVQSKGMERWVSMALARRHGVCANIRFPYPIHFVHDLFKTSITDLPDDLPYEPSIMTWNIMGILPDLLDRQAFAHLRTYLTEGEKDLKRFQLADRIAGLFDQYLLFRPDMMLAWEAGREDHWQAVLWREILRKNGPIHRAALYRQFIALMRDNPQGIAGIPERVCLFGLSALPPFHVRVLEALSAKIDVHMFLMNPCREFWGDIVSDLVADRLTAARPGDEQLPAANLHLEAGNSLLASMGALGRDFFRLITDLNAEDYAVFEDPQEETILGAVQFDILNLKDRKASAADRSRERDDSIQIHNCHSPLREIEALQDYLFALFENNTHILPDDVLVMVPDIDPYAPLIKAVFSLPPDDPRRIPFTIADRTLLRESRLMDAFLKILALPEGRMTAAEIDDILQSAPLRSKFSFSEEDLELIRHWISETGIRWGMDGDHKKALNLPGIALNTWRSGLDRLLLGYALPSGSDDDLFAGIMPYNDVEGAATETLGRFLGFAETLFGFATQMEEKRSLQAWAVLFQEILKAFFSGEDEWRGDLQSLQRIIADLIQIGTAAQFEDDVPLSVVRTWLMKKAQDKGFGHGFLAGGVTFCTLLPMRSIPFKCVCLIGMNDDAYPRQSFSMGFDLMAQAPRIGDRTRRNDDRYLFLEALLSARDRFYISYCGQSMKDNSLRPPSVLVSELADYIESAFGRDIREKLFIKHRLQAFDPDYFSGLGDLFSYSQENCLAAMKASSPRRTPPPFITHGLSEADEALKQISLDDFTRFFVHPARFLLNRRLGVYLHGENRYLEETEPFDLNGFDVYVMKQAFTEKALQGKNLRDGFEGVEARGSLPHGAPGRYYFDDAVLKTEEFLDRIRPHLEGGRRDNVAVSLQIGDYSLTGSLGRIYAEHMLHYRPAKMKAADRLRAWIAHLILNHPGVGTPVNKTILCAQDATVAFGPVREAQDYLRVLLCLYGGGLHKPLPFFPDASMMYAERTAQGKGREEALRAARSVRDSDWYDDRQDPYDQLCFRAVDPLNEEFCLLAETICGPMLRYEERITSKP